jgi:hypothetical protein
MATRVEVPGSIDEVPAARLDVIEQLLRASVAGSVVPPRRVFANAATLPSENNLADRSEEIGQSARPRRGGSRAPSPPDAPDG